MNKRRAGALGAAVLCGALVAKAGSVWWQSRSGGRDGAPLAIRWEGAVNDRNSRDLGASLNACLGGTSFPADKVWRSAVWFSGWSCSGVGQPEVIYSLNYSPDRGEEFYCSDGGTNVVGRHFNTKQLNDLEFLPTWEDAAMREGACGFFRDAFNEMAQGRRLLVHCDAGRDRTGAFAALTAALAAEAHGRLDSDMVRAIECDYRKSDSLAAAKYGRMEHLLGELQRQGGVKAFFERTCAIPAAVLDGAAAAFWTGQTAAPANATK